MFLGDFKLRKYLKDDVVWSWYLAVIQRCDSVIADVMFEINIERPHATWSITGYSRRAYHIAGCVPTLN